MSRGREREGSDRESEHLHSLTDVEPAAALGAVVGSNFRPSHEVFYEMTVNSINAAMRAQVRTIGHLVTAPVKNRHVFGALLAGKAFILCEKVSLLLLKIQNRCLKANQLRLDRGY